MKSARQSAFEILLKIEKDSAFSNLATDNALKSSSLSARDKALVSALVYGCVERKLTLDYQIEKYLTGKSKKLKKDVHTILRMGVYQILFMDKIPNSAAVNESVRLSSENNAGYASGLINAVLHKIAENGLVLPPEEEYIKYISVKYSCPESLILMWNKAYGTENTVNILKKSLERGKIVFRVNTLKTNTDELIEILKAEGIDAEKSRLIENAVETEKLSKSIENLNAYKEGLFHVQGLTSQLCVKALAPQENERIIDLCAAPGGKTFTIAETMNNTGNILSCDLYPQRTELIDKGCERLGIKSVTTCAMDAGQYYSRISKADRVLCDVPCSGLGVIRSKPEIKYKELDEFKDLPELQYKILCNGADYLKKGGRLVYSTCTLNRKENEKVCDRFLEEHPDYIYIRPLKIDSFGEKYYTFLPGTNDTDGFFIAVFENLGD